MRIVIDETGRKVTSLSTGEEVDMSTPEMLGETMWQGPDVKELAIEVAQDELYPWRLSRLGGFMVFWPPAWPALLLQRLGGAGTFKLRKMRLRNVVIRCAKEVGLSLDSGNLEAVERVLVLFGNRTIVEHLRLLEQKEANGQALGDDEKQMLKDARKWGVKTSE
jgi:hypothetical protein